MNAADGRGIDNVCDAELINTDYLNTVNLSDLSYFRSAFGKPVRGSVPYAMNEHADFIG